MNHDQIVEKLSDYRDGAMEAFESEAVSRHLPGCASCAATLLEWEQLSSAFFRKIPAPTPVQTEAFVARVMGRLPAASQDQFAWLTGRWLAPAFGLGIALLALSFENYPREVSDPTSLLLSPGADRAAVTETLRESSPADLLGFDAEGR